MYKLIYLARRAKGVSREDWPRTWRSHAVFASQFPVLEASIEWVRYCNLLEGPELPGLSTEHDGVAVVAAETMAALDGSRFTEAERARIDIDELRVFGMLTPEFTFYCTENILCDGNVGEAALFGFLARRPDMTREDFDLRWDCDHAEIAQKAIETLPALTRYVHNRPVHEPLERFPFDGIVEAWFASAEDALAALNDGALDRLRGDLPEFCDMDNSATLLTSVCHRWPKS